MATMDESELSHQGLFSSISSTLRISSFLGKSCFRSRHGFCFVSKGFHFLPNPFFASSQKRSISWKHTFERNRIPCGRFDSLWGNWILAEIREQLVCSCEVFVLNLSSQDFYSIVTTRENHDRIQFSRKGKRRLHKKNETI